jgi:hypothetical protein
MGFNFLCKLQKKISKLMRDIRGWGDVLPKKPFGYLAEYIPRGECLVQKKKKTRERKSL